MSLGTPKCMKCDKPATHKITKIVKGKVTNLYLCDEHAHSASPYLPAQKGDQGKLMELLQHFLKKQEDLLNSMATPAGSNPEASETQTSEAVCPTCGLPFAAYRKTLLLGCSDCYTAFADLLVADLQRMQGATSQQPIPEGEAAGRVDAAASPKPQAPPSQTAAPGAPASHVAQLRKNLQEAIAREDFRVAAQIRDKIRALEQAASREDASPAAPPEGGTPS